MKILEVLTPTRRIGDLGERRAALYLILHGYRILARNYVDNGYEIDIIAKKGDTIAFCEVKTRNACSRDMREARPASAVTPEKQRKILGAACGFRGYKYSGYKMRFDIIEVYYERRGKKDKVTSVNHMIAAFDRDSAFEKPYKWSYSK